jgi:DNA-binding LytR/AlgR family response regulator
MKEFPLMMILPLSFYLVLKQITNPDKKNTSHFTFQSENDKDQLRINLEDFLFANSSENYITINYMLDGKCKEHLIRKPLKILEKELKIHPQIERTHRSYLVNSQNIKAVKQIKGKVLLEVNENSLPVSKQYHHRFLKD